MVNIFKLFLVTLLLSSCTNLLYFPDKMLWGDPKVQNIEYKEYYKLSLDGTRLYFWDLESLDPNPENLVLMFHGNAQNLSAHVFNISWMTKFKTDILIFDYRGYGLSDGTPHPKGLATDGLAALNIAWEKFKTKKYKRFIVYTQSLGGDVALKALEDFENRSKINLLVLDSTFRNPQEVARNKVGVIGLLMSGESVANEKLTHIIMPTLVIHNRFDPVVPFIFGKDLFERIPATKKYFWELNEGRHGDVFFIKNGEYRREFLNLL